MKPPSKPSNVKTAFNEVPNILGLAGLLALSAATLNPIPILAGLVAEAGYLLFVPDSKWYHNRIEEKYDAEVRLRREELKKKVFPTISPRERERFLRLETNRERIEPRSEDRPYYRNLFRKLDYLLEKFLLFADKRREFVAYLESMIDEVRDDSQQEKPRFETPKDKSRKRMPDPPAVKVPIIRTEEWISGSVEEIRDQYRYDIEKLNERLGQESNLHNHALLQKRIEIMGRRSEYVSRIGDILSNLTHQMQLMEDTIGLISDEIRARSPEQVLADIDSVVNQSETLTDALREISPFDSLSIAEGAEQLYSA